jgi:hypothetical protein
MKLIITVAVLTAIFSASATAGVQSLVDGHRLKNGSVPAAKLTRSAISSLQGTPGPQGLQGNQGSQGSQGLPGVNGNNGLPGAAGLAGPKGDVGPRGDTGSQGEQGPQGPQGNQGVPGHLSSAPSDWQFASNNTYVNAGGYATVIAECPAGYAAMNGGYYGWWGMSPQTITYEPAGLNNYPSKFRISVVNNTNAQQYVQATVQCMAVS